MCIKSNTNDFIQKSKALHGDTYDYKKVHYVNNRIKVIIICSIHGEFEQKPLKHLQGHGCRTCGLQFNLKNESKLTHEFIKKASLKYNNRFDYSLVKYKRSDFNVSIICPDHGVFQQTPSTHLNGIYGCPKCVPKPKGDVDSFIEKAVKLHKNLYEYDLVQYVNAFIKIKIKCKIHGIFEQTPGSHLNGRGCPKCSHNYKRTEKSILDQCVKVHGSSYDYSQVIFKNVNSKIKIICFAHGMFEQTVKSHVYRKSGCPKCSITVSNAETKWIDTFNNPNIIRNKRLYYNGSKFYIPDGYDPETKTVYEFWGSMHHGHPDHRGGRTHHPLNYKSFDELYENTLLKIENYEKNGFNLIQIWEHEWDKQQKQNKQSNFVCEIVDD